MISFTKAVVDYFGKNGKSLPEFQAELKALTPEDRAYFIREFKKVGIEVEPTRAN